MTADQPHSEDSTDPPKWLRRRVGRLMQLLLIGVLLATVLISCTVAVFQRKLMYFPQGYMPSWRVIAPDNLTEVPFTTADGSQTAFYLAPRGEAHARTPRRVWVMFHGNAATALDWVDYLHRLPAEDVAFLLVDLPGYGLCEGAPSRDGTIRNGEGAWRALIEESGLIEPGHSPRIGVMGFSLGAAVGLEFATRHPVDRAILCAPFTSVHDIAWKFYGPLAWVARDRFDNMARLAELAARPDPFEAAIFHGTQDSIIPVAMSEKLAREHSSIATFHPVERADHNFVIDVARPAIHALLSGEWLDDDLEDNDPGAGATPQP